MTSTSTSRAPIAVVIVGGTASAALLSLVVLPVMYRTAFRVIERLRRAAPTVSSTGP